MSTLTQSVRDLGAVKLAAMAAVAFALIGFFVLMSLRMTSPVMAPLYSGLPMKDSGQIIAELDKRNIRYEVQAAGGQILVPSDQVMKVRMQLAQNGMPSNGSIVGYEIFDKSDAMGTSNFVLNVNMVRALEGELSRTIGGFDNISSARVHLVIPKKELFTRDKAEPTASVSVEMRGNGEINKNEIKAIRFLVATAVPGLKAGKITLVNSKGQLLARGMEDGEEESAFASDSDEYRVNYERRMRSTIEDLLSRSVGADKVKAEVHADINFDRVVTNSEKYDPESQVARSTQETNEDTQSQDQDKADNVSVANNLPDPNANKSGTSSNSVTKRSDATTNFEISKEVRNQVSETGTVKALSIAVLLDGTYSVDAKGNRVYVPRSAAEIAQLTSLIKSASGFNEARGDKVEVVNMQFPENMAAPEEGGAFAWLQDDLHGIIQTLVVGGVAILALLLVIRPLVTRAIEVSRTRPELEESEQAALLAGPNFPTPQLTDQSSNSEEEELISIDRISGRVKSASYRKISDILENHPEEAVTVLRQWLLNPS